MWKPGPLWTARGVYHIYIALHGGIFVVVDVARVGSSGPGFHIEYYGGNVVDMICCQNGVMPFEYVIYLLLQFGFYGGNDACRAFVATGLIFLFKALQ